MVVEITIFKTFWSFLVTGTMVAMRSWWKESFMQGAREKVRVLLVYHPPSWLPAEVGWDCSGVGLVFPQTDNLGGLQGPQQCCFDECLLGLQLVFRFWIFSVLKFIKGPWFIKWYMPCSTSLQVCRFCRSCRTVLFQMVFGWLLWSTRQLVNYAPTVSSELRHSILLDSW